MGLDGIVQCNMYDRLETVYHSRSKLQPVNRHVMLVIVLKNTYMSKNECVYNYTKFTLCVLYFLNTIQQVKILSAPQKGIKVASFFFLKIRHLH